MESLCNISLRFKILIYPSSYRMIYPLNMKKSSFLMISTNPRNLLLKRLKKKLLFIMVSMSRSMLLVSLLKTLVTMITPSLLLFPVFWLMKERSVFWILRSKDIKNLPILLDPRKIWKSILVSESLTLNPSSLDSSM